MRTDPRGDVRSSLTGCVHGIEHEFGPVAVKMALPTQSELTMAVWGRSVDASGGPVACLVAYLSNALAELHAADLGPCAVPDFERERNALLEQLVDVLVWSLPDSPERDLRTVADRIARLSRLAAQANRHRRGIELDSADYHDLWVRLAEMTIRYTDDVETLVACTPWCGTDRSSLSSTATGQLERPGLTRCRRNYVPPELVMRTSPM